MKNLILFLSALLGWQCTHAQTYNRTYWKQGGELSSQCVATHIPGNAIYFSAHYYNGIASTRLMLVKTNAQGTFLQAKVVDTVMVDHRILETRDTGLLVAAYVDSNLLVMKFNSTLTLQWSKKVPMGIDNYKFDCLTVDIERSIDSQGAEVYYILSGTPTYYAYYQQKDAAISVVKLHANGALLWHYKYADANRLSDPLKHVIDIPHSLTPADAGKTKFLIAGTRREIDSIGNYRQALFYMIINNAGVVMSDYKRVRTADREPWNPEAAWDYHKNCFVSTYRESNYTFSGDTSNINGIGFIRLSTALTPLAGRYYWRYCYNFGNSISVSADRNYTIGSYIQPCGSAMNPAFLKIDANSLAPIYFKRYNYLVSALNYSVHRADANDNNYVVPYVDDVSYGYQARARLIKTDMNGNSCGALQDFVQRREFSPEATEYTYNRQLYTQIMPYTPMYWSDTLVQDSCNTNPDKYRISPTLDIVSLYPTLIDQGLTIHCKVFLQTESKLIIQVSDIMGKVVSLKTLNASQGDNITDISTADFTPGIYVIKIETTSGIRYVGKVLVR